MLSRAQAASLLSSITGLLMGWITNLTATGYPVHHNFITDIAEEIHKQSTLDNDARTPLPIGETRVRQFIRHHPYLKMTLSRSIEAARIKDITKDIVIAWFKKLEETIEDHQITMENIYNMDETSINKFCVANVGFAIGISQSSFVVVDSRLRRKYQAEPGRQEWVTVVECICADRGLIPPLVIFKGENLLTSWISREV